MQAAPYMLLFGLTILFSRTTSGAMISLIGSVLLSGLGVCLVYSAGKEIDLIGITPVVLTLGCGIILLIQLIRVGRELPNRHCKP